MAKTVGVEPERSTLTKARPSYVISSKYLLGHQLRLIDQAFETERAPTFFDSKKAPVHRWYGIVPGFSHASVINALLENHVTSGLKTVLDPFVGCGTTIVTVKALGIKSIGIEAHPLFAYVAKVKTFWDFEACDLRQEVASFISKLRQTRLDISLPQGLPSFLLKLYEEETLRYLLYARDLVRSEVQNPNLRDLYTLALLKALKESTYAKVDGIYIAPESLKKSHKTPLESIEFTLKMMVDDLLVVKNLNYGESMIIEGDARELSDIRDGTIDFAFTSPPYLNNFDYAEMTRLELYFLEMARNWNDITRNVRHKLITNTTTQVTSSMRRDLKVSEEMPEGARIFIQWAKTRLTEMRLSKAGRKDYDIIVVNYFNEMVQHFRQMYRVLAPGSIYILTLGDSALYGILIPTPEILRDIALSVGFRGGDIEFLRRRGNRSQIDFAKRPRVPLKEVSLRLLK